MRHRLSQINLALRAVMELAIVLATGYWGYRTGATTASRVALAIAAPTLVFGFWGLVDFHQAGRAAEPLRLLQELLVTGLAAAALYVAGQRSFAVALAGLSIVHHTLVYALGNRLLKDSLPA